MRTKWFPTNELESTQPTYKGFDLNLVHVVHICTGVWVLTVLYLMVKHPLCSMRNCWGQGWDIRNPGIHLKGLIKGRKRHGVIVLLIPHVKNVTIGVSFHGNFISIVRAQGACREWGEEIEWCSKIVCTTCLWTRSYAGTAGWVGLFSITQQRYRILWNSPGIVPWCLGGLSTAGFFS